MPLYDLTTRLEATRALDGLVDRLDHAVPAVLRKGPVRDGLAGRWLGHPLHPVITDLPVGLWSSATVLDLVGGRRSHGASTLLTALGLVAATPTVASGVVEWLDADRPRQRLGVVHAAANAVAEVCYLASLGAKLAGRRRAGRRAALLGGAALGIGGYLGGHLSYARGVGVDHTLHHRAATPGAIAVTRSDDGRLERTSGETYLVVGGTAVAGAIAVPDRCTRCGGALQRLRPHRGEEELRCPHDGSRFAPARGAILAGSATTPLPRFTLARAGEHWRLRAHDAGTGTT